jgi:hypothetical protein
VSAAGAGFVDDPGSRSLRVLALTSPICPDCEGEERCGCGCGCGFAMSSFVIREECDFGNPFFEVMVSELLPLLPLFPYTKLSFGLSISELYLLLWLTTLPFLDVVVGTSVVYIDFNTGRQSGLRQAEEATGRLHTTTFSASKQTRKAG